MEFSQPRPCGAQGAKPPHDFLSLYSPAQQDPNPRMPGKSEGGYIKTHDFLQPREQSGKTITKDGNKVGYLEESFPPSPQTMVEHILPGGMGSYSISPSNINQSQKVSMPEGIVNVISAAQSSSSNNNDENSNCSSYTGSGFLLWEESNNVNKGKTGKENIALTRNVLRDDAMEIGVPWMQSMDGTPHSSSILYHPSTTFSSFSSSHPLSAPKNQCFVDMVKSTKNAHEEEDNDDEEFAIKKEPSFHHKGATSSKVDIINSDQKLNIPRSKHSATEQRRRSKINDRFSVLRGIIPHGDQKRDKASLLSEVIEYIHFLQEKVHKYEDSFQGWTNEPPKTTPTNNRQTNGFIDNNSRENILDSTPDTAPTTCTTDMLKDQQLIIESGTISISTIYSQGFSSALTEALKSSGVDLSHAKISVQIDLGNRVNAQEKETPPMEQSHPRVASTWEGESGEGLKRLRTDRK